MNEINQDADMSARINETMPPPLPGPGSTEPDDGPKPKHQHAGPNTNGIFGRFGEDFQSVGKGSGFFDVVDALLKYPARLTYEITRGNFGRTLLQCWLIITACALGYGVVTGCYSGGWQLALVPLKVLVVALASVAICLPSLYILTSIGGGRQMFPAVSGLLMQSVALITLLLIGFAPIVWLFSQSTQSGVFMGLLHLAFVCVAVWAGVRLLRAAFGFLDRRNMALVQGWGILFLLVALQMCTTLRPMIGPAEGEWIQEKKFFLTHWGDCLDGWERSGVRRR